MSHIEMQYKSQALSRAVTIQVLLPSHEGFGEQMLPCKTLYFFHGINGNARELLDFLNLRPQTLLKGMAIVLCDGENSLYADRGDGINNYRAFIEEELVKVTRETFPLSHKREDTFVGGISMGGHGALVTGFTKSDVFSKIAVLSPAIEFYDAIIKPGSAIPQKFLDMIYGSREEYLKSDASCYGALEKLLQEGRQAPQVFMSWGNQDPLVLNQDRDFAERLKNSGIEVDASELDGMHDIFLWERQLDAMFTFLAK